MTFNEETVDNFRKDFEQAMVALQEKYQISISLGVITYYADRFTARWSVYKS